MPSIGQSESKSSITWLDIIIVVFLMLIWFFIAQIWQSPLAPLMFSLSAFIVGIYFLGRYTGILQYMSLSYPTWTISGLLSIPIWLVYLAIIPATSNVVSSTSQIMGEGFIANLFGETFIIRLMDIVIFPFTESLFIIFILAFFIGIAIQRLGTKTKNSVALPLVIASAFGSLIHSSVAEKVKSVIPFQISLVQQFVSFLIMSAFGILFLAPAIITTHITKNLLILGNVGWGIAIFVCFIIIDIASLTLFKRTNTKLNKLTTFT